MKWISPIDVEEIRSRESLRRTQPCGQWLLHHDTFQSWLRSQHRMLWISGRPGSGKTVLSTSIIDTIGDHIKNDPKQVLTFFFCDKGDERNTSALTIITCVIGQILAQLDDIPDHIYTSYNIATRYGRPKISASDQPVMILRDFAQLLKKLYIIIDGVDESKDAPALMDTIEELQNSTAMIQVILLSRDIPKLSCRLSDVPKINLTSTVVGPDINCYISHELAELSLGDAELENQIFQKLSQSANGMFLWVSLMIQSLKSATSPHDIVEALSDLPIGLDITYSTILNKLAKESPRRRVLAKKVLLWICCSARPLHWNELESVLAFERSHTEFVESKKPFKSAVVELGGPLIEYLPASDVFRLTHTSVREFLLSSPCDYPINENAREFFIREDLGHHELAEVCLIYQIRHGDHDRFSVNTITFPFLEYATLFWCGHTCRASYSADLERRIVEFLDPQIRRQVWILRLLFWQSSTFPLQYLMKLQRLLQDWIARGLNGPSHGAAIDWIQDIPSILLCNCNSRLGEQDQDTDDDVHLLAELMPRISYFEKLMVIRDLSREYTMRDALSDGELWLTKALNDQRARKGSSHISIVWLMNSLGIIYDQQQRVSLSAQTQESALAIQTSVLGPDHLETIWTVNELGRVYRHLKDFEKAESMHRRALTVLCNVLSPKDLQIAWTMNTLGRTHRKQGRLAEAIALHDQALVIQRTVLGESHPHTLWALMDKAGCYREQKHFQESAELYRKALEGRERVLGTKHADTLWAMNNLGLVCADMGQIDAAKRLHERALSGQIELLGKEHTHTVWTRNVLDQLDNERRGS